MEGKVKAVFEAYTDEKRELKISPELVEKIKNAFIALEELLENAFPTSRLISQVLTFLEIAAMYVTRLLK